MENNISEELLDIVSHILQKSKNETARALVFYVYAILCSQVYLDEFEGALFTVNQSDKRARVPIVASKEIFETIVAFGEELAELEKADYVPISWDMIMNRSWTKSQAALNFQILRIHLTKKTNCLFSLMEKPK